MIGLDTNVLVRYIMQDDPVQSPKSTELIESLTSDNPGFITMVSVVELYWVLTSAYELSGKQVAQALDALLHTKQLLVERADQVMRALRVFGEGRADFADCLIERSASGAGCERTMTFDGKASKYAGMTLIA
jgi:predicted nucleic-acid-binding protein